MKLGLVETEELAVLMAALEQDLSMLIESEYAALLNSIAENLPGLPN
jgi:uncharacterized protein YlaN (UPF0358 family)